MPGTAVVTGADFAQLEVLGERAFYLHDKPDAGIWELRSRARIHTSSSIMCWAACDRLAKIAAWGNFLQTYLMVGIINGAMRLSRPWDAVV